MLEPGPFKCPKCNNRMVDGDWGNDAYCQGCNSIWRTEVEYNNPGDPFFMLGEEVTDLKECNMVLFGHLKDAWLELRTRRREIDRLIRKVTDLEGGENG